MLCRRGQELAVVVRRLPARAAVTSLAAAAGLDAVLPAAVDGVLAAAVTTDALRQEAALSATMARASAGHCGRGGAARGRRAGWHAAARWGAA